MSRLHSVLFKTITLLELAQLKILLPGEKSLKITLQPMNLTNKRPLPKQQKHKQTSWYSFGIFGFEMLDYNLVVPLSSNALFGWAFLF